MVAVLCTAVHYVSILALRMLIFALKKARASGRNVGKVFQPCFEAGIRELPFLMPEPAEKPSLHTCIENAGAWKETMTTPVVFVSSKDHLVASLVPQNAQKKLKVLQIKQ